MEKDNVDMDNNELPCHRADGMLGDAGVWV